MGRSRKIHTPATEEISAVRRGRRDKTMIIVNVLGHPKGVGGLTSSVGVVWMFSGMTQFIGINCQIATR